MDRIYPNRIARQASVLFYAIILSALVYLIGNIAPEATNPGLAFIWGLAILYIVYYGIGARFVYIEVRENELVYKRGIINVHNVTIPFSTIMESSYHQSMLGRLLGVGALDITSSHKIHIPNLPYKEVQALLTKMSHKRGGH